MSNPLLASTCERIATATMKGPRGRVDISLADIVYRPG